MSQRRAHTIDAAIRRAVESPGLLVVVCAAGHTSRGGGRPFLISALSLTSEGALVENVVRFQRMAITEPGMHFGRTTNRVQRLDRSSLRWKCPVRHTFEHGAQIVSVSRVEAMSWMAQARVQGQSVVIDLSAAEPLANIPWTGHRVKT